MTNPLPDQEGSVLPLTRYELQAVAYYLERLKYVNGYSATTHAEVDSLVDRCKEVALTAPVVTSDEPWMCQGGDCDYINAGRLGKCERCGRDRATPDEERE